MVISLNKKAPNFKLKDKEGVIHELSTIHADYVVLYFYPKDSTPGCTLEAIDFNKNLSEFEKLKTKIIGISGGNEKTKQKFCDKNKLNFTLLSDTDFNVANNYGVYTEKSFLGKRFRGIKRTTFVLDKNKKIIKVFENVRPFGHAKEVLSFIKSLS